MEQQQKTCFSCEVSTGQRPVPGGILVRGERWSIAHGDPCLAPGYLVVWTNRHVEFIGDLDDAEMREMGLMLGRASKAIQQVTGAERVYAVYAAEEVRHTHVHLIPRLRGMPDRASLLLQPFFAGEWRVDRSEVLTLVEKLRPLLASLVRVPWTRSGLPDDYEPSKPSVGTGSTVPKEIGCKPLDSRFAQNSVLGFFVCRN